MPVPAVIEVDAKDRGPNLPPVIPVQFNPPEYTIGKAAQIAEIAIPGIDSPILQFVRGQTRTLALELFFDTTRLGSSETRTLDVRLMTDLVAELGRIQPETHAPPRITFVWGMGLSFRAIVDNVQQKFTHFNPAGIPVRATLTVSFKEYKTLEEQLKELNLQSPDHTKQRVVRQRDTLARIAFEEYGDATKWRLIADANRTRLPDLRRLQPGMALEIPAVDVLGNGAGDAAMTPGAIPIYEGQEFYVPAFEVKLDGRPPGREVIRDILSVTYKDSVQEIDSFEITINNWDSDTRSFKYSDLTLFDPGKRLELSMGYRGTLRPMLSGEITSLRPTFPASGGSTLAVSGLNVLHRFRTQQESRTYVSVTDSQIAKQIGQRLNVDVVAAESPGEPSFEYLIQDNQYDIIFLMGRARQAGYDIFVKETTEAGATRAELFYQPSTTVHHPTYRLTYGKSLVEFQPELTTANQVGKVTVRGWDSVRKEPITFTATRDQLATRGVGDRGGQDAINKSIEQKAEIVATKPVESHAEAQRLATQILEGIAKEMVKGTGSVPGLPDIRAGTVLEIDGLGDRFSGRYFVVSTTHAIGDSGYTTQFECRREEL